MILPEDRNIIDDLMTEMLKEYVKPMGNLRIVWKKLREEEERTRDHILTHQRAGKKFIVKKSIPQRYQEAENKLKDMARRGELECYQN